MYCDKVTYNTYKEAIDAIKAINRNKKISMKTYKCEDCLGFHIATIHANRMFAAEREKAKYKIKIQNFKAAPKKKESNPKPFVNRSFSKPARDGLQNTFKLMDSHTANVLKQLVENKKYLE